VECLVDQGKYRLADKIHQGCHAKIQKRFRAEDDLALDSTLEKANILYHQSKYDEAERLEREVLQVRLSTLGPRHNSVVLAISRLATTLTVQKYYADAEELHNVAAQVRQILPETDTGDLFFDMRAVARAMRRQNKLAESTSLSRHILAKAEMALGSEHPSTVKIIYELASCLFEEGEFAESERLLRGTFEKQLKLLGSSAGDTINTLQMLASVLSKMGRHEEAVRCFKKVLERDEKVHGVDHPSTLQDCGDLGYCYEKQGLYNDALEWYQRGLDGYTQTESEGRPFYEKDRSWALNRKSRVMQKIEEACSTVPKVR